MRLRVVKHDPDWQALRTHGGAGMSTDYDRLRAGVEQIREMCLLERDAAFQDTPIRAGEVQAFNLCAEQLTALLDGDHQ